MKSLLTDIISFVAYTTVILHPFLLAAIAAAAAKSLQSCPTLYDPIDGSPPGSSVHGIFQVSTGVGCHCLLHFYLLWEHKFSPFSSRWPPCSTQTRPFMFVVQSLSCVLLLWPHDCSTPGFPVLHCLPELAQTHVFWTGDAIQPSHRLSW